MSGKSSIDYHTGYLHLLRAMRPFRRARAFLVAVILPSGIDEEEWKVAAKNLLNVIVQDIEIDDEEDEYRDFRRVTRAANSVDFFELSSKPHRLDHDPMATLVIGDVRTIGLVRRNEAEEIVGYPSFAIVDAVIDIATIDPTLVQRAVKNAFGTDISRQDAEEIISMPVKLRRSLRRTGRPLSQVLARLRDARLKQAQHQKVVVPTKAGHGLVLQDLHGYGEAKSWGLALVRDLADFAAGNLSWDDVDTGVLLSGPPGTGKTTFARALANSCGARLFVGSYSVWQSAGHQGDMLRAMRKMFDAAREAAPSVMLIDEIDAFVDRDKAGHHQEYMRGVVNGLLEQLDGAVDRKGVIVVGACNNPDSVDPALRRPGRLDRHIQIGLPDETARAEILRYHLQADIDVGEVGTRTSGMSGADLERLARDARRLARRAGVPVSLEHVVATLPALLQRSADQVWRIAIHEIGHAVTAAVTGIQDVQEVVVHKAYNPSHGYGGYTQYREETVLLRTRTYVADKLVTLLGGLAAEELVFGAHSDGIQLDLVAATRLATYALGTVGFGETLLSDGAVGPDDLSATRLRSYDLDRRVNSLLCEQRDRGVAMLREYREVVELLAEQLAQLGRLEGSEVIEAVREFQRRAVQPAKAV